ncbi:uncharacterized protein LOC112500464 [Cynara cardunculus var. scolymus]|uniref:uncharacterized protein LOC112500464 n=1 Tax=Cynara cardunculus var. scolymus TaxID=59895 RepID=UPI000D6272FE|nr:uncharacterized protein LOC112500464 [Cynara cardunculus var. scolymus]
MASPAAAEEQSNTKTEEGTTAFRKKRFRRVSFAENTSVHIFDRDEEYNTPPDVEPPSSPYEELGFSERDGARKQFFRNEEEDDEDDDMDELGPRSPFLRVVRSPSSGGSTIGSVTSNDEDNFFGPVSTSFIRRDFSDSAASDENHDHTMDSTAFSMHFHSIARSDSEGDLKTSTGVHLSFDEKTPTLSSIPSNTRNSMLLTLAKKPNSQPDVSTSKLSTGSQSNDMSLVGEYHAKYDYGRLSPALDALLAEGHNDSNVISHISMLKSPIKSGERILANKENGPDLMDFSYGQDVKMQDSTSHEALNEVVNVNPNEMGVASGSKLFPSKQIAFGVSSNASETQASKPLSPNQSIGGTLTAKTKEPVKDALGINSGLEVLATSQGTPSNPKNMAYQLEDVLEKENKSPLVGSITRLTDRPSYMVSNGVSLSKSPGTVTPFHNQASLFPKTESLKHGGSVSSLQRSISKLRILETSPFSAVLNAKLEDSNSRSVVGLFKMTPLGTLLEKNNKPLQANCMNIAGIKTLDTYLEEPLPSSAQKKREGESTNMNDSKTEIPNNFVPRTRKESSVEVASILVLPSENTYMQPKLLQSAGYKDDENKIGSPQTFTCSPKKFKEATTAEFRGSPYRDEKQSIQLNESVSFGLGNVGGLGESVTNTQLSTTASDGMDSLYIERRQNSTPLNVAISNVKEMLHDRKDFPYDVLCNSDLRRSLTTLSNDIEHENFQTISRESDIPMGLMKTSLLLNGRKDEQSYRQNLADQFGGSPSNRELYSVLHDHSTDSLCMEKVQPSGANQLSTGDVSSAERKRKTEDVMAEKIARIRRSSNSDVELPSDGGISSIGPNLKHLAEIHSRFFKETKLFSHSVDRMNFHTIDRLIDIVGQLQRSETYQLLSNEIQSQIFLDQGGNIQDKRVAETKYLLCKTVHEQAKLQLMHLKRERLLKSVQSLASGIQESEGLKLNYPPPNSLDVRVIHQQPFSDNIEDIQECQVDCKKLTSMMQAIEDIHRRISNLTNSFHKSCKMKGEPNPADTIAFVTDHLMKRARCQTIRKDLQLWVLDNLKSSKGRHEIVLNFLDLMTQRLTVTAGVIPSISISNILNEMNINKHFKDMDASTVFGFVFDAGITQRQVGAASLAQETQTTSSLLGNLVDVMEEIQLARIELRNLVHARFHTSLDESLYLELYFFDPNGRKKATITLNASCLKRGIYPSEIVPCQIFTPVDESQNSSSQSLSTEIAAAIRDLRVGFLRILRLCRSISQLVSPSR